MNMVILYTFLAANNEYRASLEALRRLIESAREHLGEPLSLSFYVLVEYGYAVINILKDYGVMIFSTPSRDLFRPWKWTLLLHEIGHVLFNARKHFFVTEFRRRIMPLLRQLAPTGMGEELVRGILSLWEQYWLGEFVADLYGVAMGGPAYTHAFMIEVFNSDPSEYIATHPSLDSRMYLQLRYLEGIAEIQGLVGSVRELWLSHRKSIVADFPSIMGSWVFFESIGSLRSP